MVRKPFLVALAELIAAYWPHTGLRTRWARRLGTLVGHTLLTVAVVAGVLWAQSVGAVPLGTSRAAPAGTPTTIAYQGRLADSAGNPLTGTYNMVFRLYNVPTGGAPLWTEQWTGSNAVQVSDGLFNVMLGSLSPIAADVIAGNDSLWLGITVGTDDEMTPRVQLGNVPWAVQALTVPDGSITTEKIPDGAVTREKLAPGGVQVPIYSATTTVTNWRINACDSSPYAVPGLSIDLTVDVPSILDITSSGLGMNTKPGAATYAWLYVDGSPIGANSGELITGCRNGAQSGGAPWCTFANAATKAVSPGAHTVQVRVECDGGNDATGYVWSGSLIVRVYPQ